MIAKVSFNEADGANTKNTKSRNPKVWQQNQQQVKSKKQRLSKGIPKSIQNLSCVFFTWLNKGYWLIELWNLVATCTLWESSQMFPPLISNLHTLHDLKLTAHHTLRDNKITMPEGAKQHLTWFISRDIKCKQLAVVMNMLCSCSYVDFTHEHAFFGAIKQLIIMKLHYNIKELWRLSKVNINYLKFEYSSLQIIFGSRRQWKTNYSKH